LDKKNKRGNDLTHSTTCLLIQADECKPYLSRMEKVWLEHSELIRRARQQPRKVKKTESELSKKRL
jgi:hypothetical protein